MRGRDLLLGIAATLLVAACDTSTSPSANESLDAAFATGLFGFGDASSSFEGSPQGDAWMPGGPHHHGPPGMGPGGGPGMDGLMGGGLGGLFRGEGFGPGFGRGHHGDPSLPDDCTFDSASGRVVCEPLSHDGLTVERSAAYFDESGNLQTEFDSLTTNTIDMEVLVSGTVTRPDGATSTVAHQSHRAVSGLAPGSTQRTVNGTSAGSENTTGTNDQGDFTAVRVMGDTITDLVIPVRTDDGPPPYPLAGTVVRSMEVTLTYDGGSPTMSSRREVVTYDGSDTATIVITRDGESTTCSLPLPRGRPICP